MAQVKQDSVSFFPECGGLWFMPHRQLGNPQHHLSQVPQLLTDQVERGAKVWQMTFREVVDPPLVQVKPQRYA